MPADQLVVIWVSMLGSLASALLCSYAAIKVVSWKFSSLVKLSLVISATLALAYFVSYIWLLIHTEQVANWSNTMRPIGMGSWLLGPWLALPLALLNQIHKLRDRMESSMDDLFSVPVGCESCYETFGGCPVDTSGITLPESCPLRVSGGP